MSTPALFKFIDADGAHLVYKHWDGDPASASDYIEKAKRLAWDLPRFEPDEFAAAFVAGNKGKGGGDVRLARDLNDYAEYLYEVRCINGVLQVCCSSYEGSEKTRFKKLFAGTLDEFRTWAALEGL